MKDPHRRGRLIPFRPPLMLPPDVLRVVGDVVAVAPVDGGFVVEADEARFRLEAADDGWTLAPLPN